ncbi:MAG: polysaccharide deacetylase family protein [Candidatus Bipolaricaulota bacterium]|nr:polysaccharide deacetylase family protein [Candidatus Bipolaricaulota bacterium]MDW8031071.1 polysaccharide deacetylase family protein [Candidatus Bipolaricaulota bacterium]
MRAAKVVSLLVGAWVLCVLGPISGPASVSTLCGHALAQGAYMAWYGPLILTSGQLIAGIDDPRHYWGEECQLIAAVSLHFGDYEKVFTEAFPILQRYQTPATVWIVTGRIGQPSYMTLEQIKELAKNNWEIGSHTVTHRPLAAGVVPALTPPEIRAELEDSKAFLERTGFSVSGFLSPFGLYNELILNEIQRVYRYHRSNVFPGINPLPLAKQGLQGRWELVYFRVQPDTPPQEVIIEIDRVNRRGGWLIIDFHDMGDHDPSVSYPPESLERIVRFMRAELRLCTLEELHRGACQARR